MAENGGREKSEHGTTWSSKTSSGSIKLNKEKVL
jgi:hypothetical protein